jgi:hypothetical protein
MRPISTSPLPTHAASPGAPARDVTFFGYWSGRLPAVTELHFRSFLHHHPDARYELWLDDDHGSAIDAASLQWLKDHPRIAVRRFSLNALIEKHVSERPVCSYDRFGGLRRVARALHRKLAPRGARGHACDHPVFGLTYKHSSRLFAGFNVNKAYRGDLARALIPLEHYKGSCLYVDLDTCFLSDLRAICGPTAWTYRWEKYDFANSAILYLPDPAFSAALVAKGRAIGCFLPWVLFTDACCNELGVHVHPTRDFDPLWDPASLLYGDPKRFFCKRDQLALDLYALALERHLAIHWHNNWQTTPEPTSIYAGLLKACTPFAPAGHEGERRRGQAATVDATTRSTP